MTSPLPSKLFFRIGEVASLVGVEPHVLRYWEREFRSIRPTKSAKGQRVYSRKDVENLLRVRDLLYRDGFTIAGAKKRLQRGVASTEGDRSTDGDARDGGAPTEDISDTVEHPVEHALAHEPHEPHEREEDVALTQPESGPRAQVDPVMRRKLNALRAEVESFLVDFESA